MRNDRPTATHLQRPRLKSYLTLSAQRLSLNLFTFNYYRFTSILYCCPPTRRSTPYRAQCDHTSLSLYRLNVYSVDSLSTLSVSFVFFVLCILCTLCIASVLSIHFLYFLCSLYSTLYSLLIVLFDPLRLQPTLPNATPRLEAKTAPYSIATGKVLRLTYSLRWRADMPLSCALSVAASLDSGSSALILRFAPLSARKQE